jgi:glutathione S-transferase
MRARLALLVSDTVCEIREVKLAHKPQEMIAVSPKATVPVVLLPDGRVIDQSLDIMRWALDGNDPEGWRERDDGSLIEVNDGAFKYHLDRYKYADRHNADRTEHRASGLRILELLDARLGSHANLCGDERGLADAAIMPFVRQFAETDRRWFDAQPLLWLQAWLERHLASPLFKAAMVRLQPWQAHDAPIRFATDG